MTFTGPERVSDPTTLEAIYRLRAAVWRETGDIAQAAFGDGRWSDKMTPPPCTGSSATGCSSWPPRA